MGDATESTDVKLEALVQFFAVSVQLFAASAEEDQQQGIDNKKLRNCSDQEHCNRSDPEGSFLV